MGVGWVKDLGGGGGGAWWEVVEPETTSSLTACVTDLAYCFLKQMNML